MWGTYRARNGHRSELKGNNYGVLLLFVFWLDSPPPPTSVDRGLIHEVSRSRTTTHHSRQDSQQTDKIHAPVRYEPRISAGERPQSYALDRTATGTGLVFLSSSSSSSSRVVIIIILLLLMWRIGHWILLF